MYVVDRSKILSIRLKKAKEIKDFVYKKEVKNIFGNVSKREGWYRRGAHYGIDELFIVDGKVCYKPSVTVKFINKDQFPDYFEFDTYEEALEFFNKIADPNHSIK